MRKLLFFVCALLVAPMFAQVDTQDDTIEWTDNYEQALAEAKRTGKPIFLEFRCEA